MTIHRPVAPARQRLQRGSSLVESAICLLGFFFLMIGLMEVSLAVLAYNQSAWLARDGVRFAHFNGNDVATPATNDSVQTYVRNSVMFFPQTAYTVQTTWCADLPACTTFTSSGSNGHGSQVRVSVTYSGMPLVGLVLHGALAYTTTAQVYMAH
jgi:hypothetical protein